MSSFFNSKRRNFFKLTFYSLLIINFLSISKTNEKSIVTKKIGDEYWILSSDDL